MELERRAREEIERSAKLKLKREAARHTMALWNAALAAGWRTIFYPSIGTALATGCHWLHVVCPACRQVGEADLRTIDIHPNASIGTIVRAMSCRRCSPHPPFARPTGATRRSWESFDGWDYHRREREKNFRNTLLTQERPAEGGWAQNQIKNKTRTR